MRNKILIGFAALIILPVVYYLVSPIWRVVEKNEPSPVEDQLPDGSGGEFTIPEILSEGEFTPKAHDVKGAAILLDDSGKKIIRFQDFETINGPGLFIWLSADLEGEDYVDLGPIKATKGNVNYEVPEGTDLNKYNKVLVWCKPFGVLFSYAVLQ